MDCSDALNDFHDSSHDFSTHVGGYLDGDSHVSIGDIVSSAIDSASGYVIVDSACGGGDAGAIDSGATD